MPRRNKKTAGGKGESRIGAWAGVNAAGIDLSPKHEISFVIHYSSSSM